jgi:hypothetical protein
MPREITSSPLLETSEGAKASRRCKTGSVEEVPGGGTGKALRCGLSLEKFRQQIICFCFLKYRLGVRCSVYIGLADVHVLLAVDSSVLTAAYENLFVLRCVCL